MDYSIHELAQMAGVSTRTLRYYDTIGLLAPACVRENGYRLYRQEQVDLLQQILLYRTLGLPLDAIRQVLTSPDFNREMALQQHLTELLERQRQLERLIANVRLTLADEKGETIMSNEQKFDGLREKHIAENEQKYGKEARQKYGDEAVDGSYARVRSMSDEQWAETEALRTAAESMLREAVTTGDPAGETAQAACELHRQWICRMWPAGTYSKAAHRGLGEMYAADERFTAYYERVAPGAAAFLRDALAIFCAE